MLVLALIACKPTPTPDPDDSDTDVVVEPTADTAPPVPTADTAPELDCSQLPPLPATYDTLTGFTYAEDFDFDTLGRHVSVRASNGNLIALDMATNATLLSPNVANTAACTRRLPDGNFVVCNVGANSLVVVDITTGGKTTLISGLAYPNGADVDAEGWIYVAEQNASRLRRVHYQTGESQVLGTGLNAANGVVLGPGEQTVYVGSFGGGQIYAIDRTGPDTWGSVRIHAQAPGGGEFDGLEADACGNLYVTEYVEGKVWRVYAGATGVDVVATLPSDWIPNLRWGEPAGGWDPHTLYVSDRQQGRLFALQMSIGKAN